MCQDVAYRTSTLLIKKKLTKIGGYVRENDKDENSDDGSDTDSDLDAMLEGFETSNNIFEDNLFDALVSVCSDRSMESIWSLMNDQSVPEQYGQWDLSSIKNWIQNTK